MVIIVDTIMVIIVDTIMVKKKVTTTAIVIFLSHVFFD